MVASNSFHEAQVLLVEDTLSYLEELQEWLKIFGYQHVQSARNADEAIAKLGHIYDIIVSDQRMDNIDDSGFDVLAAVKEQNITSIVIILTANETVDYCRRACKAGAWDYISKTMKGNAFDELHKSIQEALQFRAQWGNHKDERWFNEQVTTLQQKYGGQYIAILNNAVLESAPSEAELKQKLATLRLPSVAVVIKKVDAPFSQPLLAELTVFVEGPTDVKYIKTAARLLGYEDLLKRVELKTTGDLTGNEFGGEKNLSNSFQFLKHNPKFRPHKVLFLYDPDIKDSELPLKGEGNYENLYIRRTNAHNPKKIGSEHLFDNLNDLLVTGFSAGCVQKVVVETIHTPNPQPTYTITSKVKFCDWLCDEHLTSPADFANFKLIFQLIQEILDQPQIGI